MLWWTWCGFIGVTDDLARAPLPRILREFREMYPSVDLLLLVAQNDILHSKLAAGQLDIAFLKHTAGQRAGRLLRRERLV